MAFLVIGAIHQTIRGVQSGIQAHKDFKANTDPQTQDQGGFPSGSRNERIEPPLDRYGHPTERHPVYGWVMKAEHKFNKGKGKGREAESDDGHVANQRTNMPEVEGLEDRQLNKEELEREKYGSQKVSQGDDSVSGVELSVTCANHQAAPPSYETAVSGAGTSRSTSTRPEQMTGRRTTGINSDMPATAQETAQMPKSTSYASSSDSDGSMSSSDTASNSTQLVRIILLLSCTTIRADTIGHQR